MGAKTWFVAWIEPGVDVRQVLQSAPTSDVAKAISLAKELYPKADIEKLDDSNLCEGLNPGDDLLNVGCFSGVTFVATVEVGADHPSKIPARFRPSRKGRVVLHAMHSVVDWFAFAVWEDGKLVRSLSLSPDNGVMEDIGKKFAFELPYWEGKNPLEDDGDGNDYPFKFHPLELGEAALRNFFGFVLEGGPADNDPEPFDIGLSSFRVL